MLTERPGSLTPKPESGLTKLKPQRVREISAQELVDELNHVVDRHNAMAADFLRCLVWLTRQLAVSRRKADQFDALLEENNRFLYLAQRSQMFQDENDHLWRVIADLDAELRKCSPDD